MATRVKGRLSTEHMRQTQDFDPATDSTVDLQTDFLRTALAARERGFNWLTPLKNKTAFLRGWNRYNQCSNETQIRAIAHDYPAVHVGIISKRGVGNLFFWYIDKLGVIERVTQETGRTLPDTYMTLTRPKSALHKMHVYFYQTAYSVSKFVKQRNCGDYDLKGIGGAGYVVAEGCVRDDKGTVEVVTGNGLPVIDIPDWLTDWLDKDSRKLQAELTKQRKAEGLRLAKGIAERDLRTKEALIDEGIINLVPKGSRTHFLWSRAYSLSNLG